MPMIQSKHPLSLPEIQIAVALYLDKRGLATAALVCKNWNASFSSLLYQKAEVDNISVKNHVGLSAHAVHVRDLTLHMYRLYDKLPSHLFIDGDRTKGLIFTRLRNLYLKLSTDKPSGDWWRGASLIFSQNPGLEELRVAVGISAILIKALSESCVRLTKLSIWDLTMDLKAIRALLELCTTNRLDSLIMAYVDSSNDGEAVQALIQEWASPGMTLPLKLQELRFRGDCSLSLSDQIAWAQRCPQLKILELYLPVGHCDAFPTTLLCEAISTTLLELCHLDLHSKMLTMADLAQILSSFGSAPRIKYFRLGKPVAASMFKPLEVWPLLDRHMSVLTHLNMGLCSTFWSTAVQHALATFPHLISLQAKYLRAMDILGIRNEADKAIEIPPWVCKGLKHLEVHIDGFQDRPAHWNPLVLKQISTLESLEFLGIRLYEYDWYNEEYRRENSLDLRLEAGLSVLANLTRMKRVSYSPELQNVGTKELEWMKNTWPRFDTQSV